MKWALRFVGTQECTPTRGTPGEDMTFTKWECQGVCVPGSLLVAALTLLDYMLAVYWQAHLHPRGDIQINTYSYTHPPEPHTRPVLLTGIQGDVRRRGRKRERCRRRREKKRGGGKGQQEEKMGRKRRRKRTARGGERRAVISSGPSPAQSKKMVWLKGCACLSGNGEMFHISALLLRQVISYLSDKELNF